VISYIVGALEMNLKLKPELKRKLQAVFHSISCRSPQPFVHIVSSVIPVNAHTHTEQRACAVRQGGQFDGTSPRSLSTKIPPSGEFLRRPYVHPCVDT
jgi:hypothetical protein